MRSMFAVLVLLAAAALVAPARAQDAATTYTLDNGLDVVLRPAPSGQRLSVAMLYDIGGIQDPPGKSGLAHLIEHLYVTAATGSTPAGTAQTWSSRYPMGWNAQTTLRHTIIATVVSSLQLESEIAEAAARMRDLRIEPTDLARELPRIERELANMYGRMPNLATMNLARREVQPYPRGGRHGGTMAELQTVTLDEARAWHRDYYKPINATIVVAGAFNPDSARELIEKHFGSLEPGTPAPEAPNMLEPTHMPPVRLDMTAPQFGRWPAVFATTAFRAPEVDDPNFAPFLIIVGRLIENSAADMGRLQALQGQGHSVIPPVQYPFIEDHSVLWVNVMIEQQGDPTDPLDLIRRRVAVACDPERPVNLVTLQMQLGPVLGLSEIPPATISMNPYFAAVTAARRHQLGLDDGHLKAKLEAVTPADLERCAREVFGEDQGAPLVLRLAPNRPRVR